jgi:hypothetical protein
VPTQLVPRRLSLWRVAIAYGAELCYLGATGYGAEQRVQK